MHKVVTLIYFDWWRIVHHDTELSPTNILGQPASTQIGISVSSVHEKFDVWTGRAWDQKFRKEVAVFFLKNFKKCTQIFQDLSNSLLILLFIIKDCSEC